MTVIDHTPHAAESPHVRAGQLHSQIVAALGELITKSRWPVATLAADAGIMPSKLERILGGHEVLGVSDLVAVCKVLHVQAADLVGLCEDRQRLAERAGVGSRCSSTTASRRHPR